MTDRNSRGVFSCHPHKLDFLLLALSIEIDKKPYFAIEILMVNTSLDHFWAVLAPGRTSAAVSWVGNNSRTTGS